MEEQQLKLKEHFLEPETRCGTYISAEKKASWKVMLDLLECFMQVCDKYHLRWSLSAGSLLGAIRHGGIIPWDDDIDVEMPRVDYDQLQKVMPGELPPYYFMQTSQNEKEYSISHVKLRDSRTTGIDIYHAKRNMRFNMGIFLDIFPLDGCPKTEKECQQVEKETLKIRRIRRNAYVHVCKAPWDWAKHLYGWTMFHLIGRNRIFNKREELFRNNKIENCEYTVLAASEYGFKDKYKWPRSLTSEYREVPFEYLQVKVYRQSEEILSHLFGDWHKFVKGETVHQELILDAHRDYKQTLCERFGYRMSDFEN